VAFGQARARDLDGARRRARRGLAVAARELDAGELGERRGEARMIGAELAGADRRRREQRLARAFEVPLLAQQGAERRQRRQHAEGLAGPHVIGAGGACEEGERVVQRRARAGAIPAPAQRLAAAGERPADGRIQLPESAPRAALGMLESRGGLARVAFVEAEPGLFELDPCGLRRVGAERACARLRIPEPGARRAEIAALPRHAGERELRAHPLGRALRRLPERALQEPLGLLVARVERGRFARRLIRGPDALVVRASGEYDEQQRQDGTQGRLRFRAPPADAGPSERGPARGGGKVEQAIWIGYGLLAGICWILGIRAVQTARRTGSAIDWALAVVTLAAGGFGCPLTFLPSLVPLEAGLRAQVLAAGMIGLGFASASIYVATWRRFRRASVLAALVCTAGTFVIAWSILAEILTAGFAWGRDRRWLALGGAASWLPYAWGSVEMILASRKRPGESGAAEDDPDARGLFLYGLALAAVALVYLPGLVSAYRSRGGNHSPFVVGLVGATGFVAALAAAIGFYWSSRRRRDARAAAEPYASSSARST